LIDVLIDRLMSEVYGLADRWIDWWTWSIDRWM